MQVCPILSESNVLDLVHYCPTSMLSEVRVDRIIDTGYFGLVLIVTTPSNRQYAVKLEAVRYNPAVQERITRTLRQKQRVVTLNEILFQEVTALCRVSDLIKNGIADQFPIIHDYQVCPIQAIPAPFTRRLLEAQNIPNDNARRTPSEPERPTSLIEASTIVMSYIAGDSVLNYHRSTHQPLPLTCQFDCLYGIFALVFQARINLMLDLDVQNLLIDINTTDTYYTLNYHDDTGDPATLNLRFPSGASRLKFIDFGAAIPIPPNNFATATIYTYRSALDPIHLVSFYRDQPDLFPLLSVYRAQLERPTRPLTAVWDFFCNYIVEPTFQAFQVSTIPPQVPLYELSFP